MFGMSMQLLYLLFGLFGTVFLYLLYNMTYWMRRGAPYIKPNLLFGSFADLIMKRKSGGQFLQDLHKQGAGHRFIGIWTLQTPTILIRDPLLLKEIMVKEYSSFCDRFSGGEGSYDAMARRNLFMTNNPEWKYLRTKLTPTFTGVKLRNMSSLIHEVGGEFMRFLQEKAGEDGVVLDTKKLCNGYSVNVIVSCAFGIKSNAIYDEKCKYRQAAESRRYFAMIVYFMLPQLIDILRIELFGRFKNFFREVFWESINRREQTGVKRGDVVDSLLEIRKGAKDGEFKFEGDNLVSQAVVFFFAGFETQATTFAFVLYHFALEPEIQDRARAEAFAVKEKFGGFPYESMTEMKYIDMVINEVLRMHPPMPILNRVCKKDYKIPGSEVVIEKGTPVWISMLGLHMDPENFPDPEEFDPERFSEERKPDIKPFTYMPFGEGPKICIGMRFAMMSLRLGITRFLTNFKAERCPQTQVPIKLLPGTVVTTPERGLEIRIVPLTITN